ncbi:MAG: hypothetical protein R2795_16840 [Saprospiraceae bacterium]
MMEIWQYPYEVHYTTVHDSIRMAYIDEGECPVLLFIHGLGSNLQAWQKNINHLRDYNRCDSRGFARLWQI